MKTKTLQPVRTLALLCLFTSSAFAGNHRLSDFDRCKVDLELISSRRLSWIDITDYTWSNELSIFDSNPRWIMKPERESIEARHPRTSRAVMDALYSVPIFKWTEMRSIRASDYVRIISSHSSVIDRIESIGAILSSDGQIPSVFADVLKRIKESEIAHLAASTRIDLEGTPTAINLIQSYAKQLHASIFELVIALRVNEIRKVGLKLGSSASKLHVSGKGSNSMGAGYTPHEIDLIAARTTDSFLPSSSINFDMKWFEVKANQLMEKNADPSIYKNFVFRNWRNQAAEIIAFRNSIRRYQPTQKINLQYVFKHPFPLSDVRLLHDMGIDKIRFLYLYPQIFFLHNHH